MLGVIIGVAAVIAMVSIGQELKHQSMRKFKASAQICFLSVAGAANNGGVRSGTADLGRRTLTEDDIVAIQKEVPSSKWRVRWFPIAHRSLTGT